MTRRLTAYNIISIVMASSNNLFRPIGDIAVNTDAQPEVDDNDARLQDDQPQFELGEGEEREVQQIESLCMECGEQVRQLNSEVVHVTC
jgi:hypothetical protein